MKKSSLITRTTRNYQVNATRVTLVNAEKFLRNFFFSSRLSPAAVPSHLERSLSTTWRRNRLTTFAIHAESFHGAITWHACVLAVFQQNIA